MMFKNEEKKPEEVKELTIEDQIKAAEAQLVELKKVQAAKLEAEKEAAKATRKDEAEVVKTAITKRLEGEAAARKAKTVAYKAYLEACDRADEEVRKLKADEKEKLNAFCKKYGSFHDSITIGDATYSCSYSTENQITSTDPFKKLVEFWF